jgi:hypothetical protein
LSRKRAICQLVLCQSLCKTWRGTSKIFLASRQISTWPVVFG